MTDGLQIATKKFKFNFSVSHEEGQAYTDQSLSTDDGGCLVLMITGPDRSRQEKSDKTFNHSEYVCLSLLHD